MMLEHVLICNHCISLYGSQVYANSLTICNFTNMLEFACRLIEKLETGLMICLLRLAMHVEMKSREGKKKTYLTFFTW